MAYKIRVYMVDSAGGYEYEVEMAGEAIEHAGKILAEGYRRVVGGTLVWFPPHRIYAVKVIGGKFKCRYPDEAFVT